MYRHDRVLSSVQGRLWDLIRRVFTSSQVIRAMWNSERAQGIGTAIHDEYFECRQAMQKEIIVAQALALAKYDFT